MIKKKESSGNEKIDPRSLLTKVTKEMENKGITFFEPDKNLNINEEYLILPKDITDCSGVELGRYLNAFVQQKMYVRTLIGWQSLVVEERKREYQEASSKAYKTFSSNSKMSETAKDKLIIADPQTAPVYNSMRDEQSKLAMAEMYLASIEDCVFLISREISRRNRDWESETRNENVQNKRRFK